MTIRVGAMSARKAQEGILPYLYPYTIVNVLSRKGEADMIHPGLLISRTTEFALSRVL